MKRRPNLKQNCKESDSDLKQQSRKYWSEEEDNKLITSVASYGSNWKLIAEYVPGRNASQCAQRWKRIKPKENERNQKWTEEEDREVLRLTGIHQFNWKQIANELQHRTGRQIRERYVNHLDPNIIRTTWTKAEDKKIWEMYEKMGTRWSDMSKKLPGRPENMIKNRFYSYIRKQYGKIQNPYYVVPNKVRNLEEDLKSSGTKKIQKFKKIRKQLKQEEEIIQVKLNEEEEQQKQKEIEKEKERQTLQMQIECPQQTQQQLFQQQFSSSQFGSIQQFSVLEPGSYFHDSLKSDSFMKNQYPEQIKQYQDFQKWLQDSLKSQSSEDNQRFFKIETPMMSFLYMDPSLIHSFQQFQSFQKEEDNNEKFFTGFFGQNDQSQQAIPVQMRPDIFADMMKQYQQQPQQQSQQKQSSNL